MTLPLRFKIIGAFSLIVLLSLSVTVSAAGRLTRQRFIHEAYQRDLSRAEVMASFLAFGFDGENFRPFEGGGRFLKLPPSASREWRGTRGSVTTRSMDDDDDYDDDDYDDDDYDDDDHDDDYDYDYDYDDEDEDFPGTRGNITMRFMDSLAGRMMHGGHSHTMKRPQSAPGVREPLNDGVVLTDVDGRVLIDTAQWGRPILDPVSQSPAPVLRGGRVVGYLYVGRMIPGYTDNGTFLQVAGAATWIVSALVFALALVLGIILTRHIVTPIGALNAAAVRVGEGVLSTRVPATRGDELGDLLRGFNDMTSALENSDSQRRRLIADSAHELRTPVSLIRARIELMQEGIYPLNAESLLALAAESDRLVQLVDDLRVLANLEARAHSSRSVIVPIRDLFSDAASAAMPIADGRGITINIKADSGSVRGDPRELYRLFSNLLSNALRHARSKIVLCAGESEEGICLSVEDDGPGIPEAERKRVFDRYYRVDASRSRDSGGLGLGLAICVQIVRSHGGHIDAESSEILGGAAFRILLPKS